MKLFTIKKIPTLAKVLGPKRTVEELLEFIDSQLDILDDEVLYGLVEELELFLPLVGGPDHCHELLSILLRISRSVDETLVRNKAVEAIKKLLSDIDQQLTEKFLIASLVGNNDNVWFSEKCSTLSLIPVSSPNWDSVLAFFERTSLFKVESLTMILLNMLFNTVLCSEN